MQCYSPCNVILIVHPVELLSPNRLIAFLGFLTNLSYSSAMKKVDFRPFPIFLTEFFFKKKITSAFYTRKIQTPSKLAEFFQNVQAHKSINGFMDSTVGKFVHNRWKESKVCFSRFNSLSRVAADGGSSLLLQLLLRSGRAWVELCCSAWRWFRRPECYL